MIRIYKSTTGIILEKENSFFLSPANNWDELVNRQDLYQALLQEMEKLQPSGNADWLGKQELLAPIGSQEVWAAGVTYLRSKTARMEESRESGGASFYDKVYDAERPELFFKASPARVSGTAASVRIRRDSTWNVPEPELTLFINSKGIISGYTIGNDMSSRSIEGENPLYLPQAKIYQGSAALGPCLLVTEQAIPSSTGISMTVKRGKATMFEGSTTIDKMKRTHSELAGFLFRECNFDSGVYLMTGTCVVPPNEFTLQEGDVITIGIDHIGTLVNYVALNGSPVSSQ